MFLKSKSNVHGKKFIDEEGVISTVFNHFKNKNSKFLLVEKLIHQRHLLK